MIKLDGILKRDKGGNADVTQATPLRRKHALFKDLLSSNGRGMKIVSELEGLIYGPMPFTLDHVQERSEELFNEVGKIIRDLEGITGRQQSVLSGRLDVISAEVAKNLTPCRSFSSTELVIPIEKLSRKFNADVGGKAANLGEIANHVGLPVPRGFAVTAYACQLFLEQEGLRQLISGKLKGLDITDTGLLVQTCEAIQSAIENAPLPPQLEKALVDYAEAMWREAGPELRLSVRSSATSEDSEASFAGQHASILNVRPDNIIFGYKKVVASTFSPRAVFYRRSKGYSEQDVMMSVLCIAMVDSKVSGVLYTVDPNAASSGDMLISAAWGLGVTVVDGSGETDRFHYSRTSNAIESIETGYKKHQVIMGEQEGLVTVDVDPAIADKACLTTGKILQLVDYGLRMEAHYGMALDIEWALDRDDRLIILQGRPLGRIEVDIADYKPVPPHEIDADILLMGGETACSGPASGPAHILLSESALQNIPQGSILIAHKTSPAYVAIMGRIKGIITDVGSVAGHMATVAREFRLPTLVGTLDATSIIPDGEIVTLDASNKIVYAGRVSEVADRRRATNPMKNSPVFRMVENALRFISPLGMTDPKAESFKAENCGTIHDIIRFTHELSMLEMFKMSNTIDDDNTRGAVRLKAQIPMILYLLDLGGGLRPNSLANKVTPADITSVPLKALWRGFTHPGVTWTGSVGLDLQGFMSSMANQATSAEMPGGDSYALVSNDYVNINARFGYHFAILDACASDDPGANHLKVQFAGGISAFEGRCLRVQFLAEVLARLGLQVDCTGDRLDAGVSDLSKLEMEKLLDLLGRLLVSSRLLDMVIKTPEMVNHLIDRFFAGEYDYLGQGATSQIPEFYTHIGNWKLREDDGKKVVVTDNSDRFDILTRAVSGVINWISGGRRKKMPGSSLNFPLAVARNLEHGNGAFDLLVRPVSGSLDRAGGIAFAVENPSNFLAFGLSGKDDQLALYAFEDGQCRVLAQTEKRIESGTWHKLRVTVEEQRVCCWYEEELSFEYVADRPLGGWLGMWSRADSVTEFADFRMEGPGGRRQIL